MAIRALCLAILPLVCGCSVPPPATALPPFPEPLASEVSRAQTEIALRTAGACSPAEQAVLTEGMALHAAAVALDLTPAERARLDARAEDLARARFGLSLRCRNRLGAAWVGPVRAPVAYRHGVRLWPRDEGPFGPDNYGGFWPR